MDSLKKHQLPPLDLSKCTPQGSYQAILKKTVPLSSGNEAQNPIREPMKVPGAPIQKIRKGIHKPRVSTEENKPVSASFGMSSNKWTYEPEKDAVSSSAHHTPGQRNSFSYLGSQRCCSPSPRTGEKASKRSLDIALLMRNLVPFSDTPEDESTEIITENTLPALGGRN